MHFTYRNVNDAFRGLVGLFADPKREDIVRRRPSRNGDVLVIDEPVIITYTHPTERVLFNEARDANPFFHLYESLWMLTGRNDVASVAYYAKQMNEYSDDGQTLNGAYGYRWRKATDWWRTAPELQNSPMCEPKHCLERVDQLDILVNHLKADPTSRRAVLQMWNVEDDLLKIGGLKENPTRTIGWNSAGSKDVCCNISVMFSLVPCEECLASGFHRYPDFPDGKPNLSSSAPCSLCRGSASRLDMTVTNRSNDLIWGLLGANYVHFTVLQEYMAARLDSGIGRYNHFTNNLHAYTWNWKPDEWLAWGKDEPGSAVGGPVYLPTKNGFGPNIVRLVRHPEAFDEEAPLVVEHFNGGIKFNSRMDELGEPFLRTVAAPALRAHQLYKLGEYEMALRMCELIMADDWKVAAKNWLKRRAKSAVGK